MEAPIAVQRAAEGTAHVIPVLLKRCDWYSSGLSRFQALPNNGKPICEWSKQETAYDQVVTGIKGVIDQLAESPFSASHLQSSGHLPGSSVQGTVTMGDVMEKRAMAEIDVFMSHSSRDEEIARRLITLIRAALNLPSQGIRCTTVDGFRLPVGISTDEKLRQEIYDSKTFIGIITPNSMESAYVLFELGARWGTQKPMIPLLACGGDSRLLKGPLSAINALNCNSPAQLHQFIEDLARFLDKLPDRPAAYQKFINEVVDESKPK